jgi:hypothetical protein
MWSSLIKYYLFMTSGSWGLWHDEVLKGTFTGIPLRLNCDSAVRDRIVGIVRRLRSVPDMSDSPLFQRAAAHSQDQLRHLERELDDAVFELFGLTPEERSRVLDFCETGLDLFYNGMASDAVRKIRWPVGAVAFGRTQDVCIERTGDLTEYLRVFLGTWEPRLVSQAGNLRWRIIQSGDDAAVIAAIFQTESAQDQLEPPDDDDEHAWSSLLQQLQRTSRQTFFASRVYVDGFVRVVSKNDIIILKRNERRLWTASAASEDAEATMLMAMMDSSPPRKARPSVTQG